MQVIAVFGNFIIELKNLEVFLNSENYFYFQSMHPYSFQYQSTNIQKPFGKTPNFITNKLLDKSAPNLPTKNSSYHPHVISKQGQNHHNQNKIQPLHQNHNFQNSSNPKSFIEKNGSLLSFSSQHLKTFYSPQVSKNQQRFDRINRGQMSRSLIIEQTQSYEDNLTTSQKPKRSTDPPKFIPMRRAPRMSEGYQPSQNQFNEAQNDRQTHKKHEKLTNIAIEKESNFMKIKKYREESKQKKVNVPSFLTKGFNDMKRSSVQLYNAHGSDQSINLASSSMTFHSSSKRKIASSDFQKIKQLGNGKYGRVYLVRQKKSGFICALKVIEKKLLVQEEITEQFIRQLKIQMYLNHSNIIKMFGYFDDEKNIYIILEVGTGGQLYHYMKKSQTLPEPKVAFLMRQVCEAVNQIHSLRIIHRDIKPENIVLHDNIIKLCDFGWSVHQDNKLRTTFCGTPLYVCPQILRGKQYDEKIDIWSLGIMMYEMIVGQNPFKITKEEELIKIVKDQIKIPSYVYVSPEARDFLDKCLQKNPADRVTIRELINHAFFKKYQEKDKKSFNL